MRAFVPAQVDPLACAGDPRKQRLDELVRLTHEREDGAVVIGVDMHVEQPRRRGESHSQRLDDVGVAALREVRHGFEHESYSRSVKAYYEARAEEYDDWWVGAGLFEQRDRPGWESERESLFVTLAALQPVPTLDVACGTGYLTRYLPGRITCLDQSPAMLEVASTRIPAARFVQSDALPLPFADRFVRARLHEPLLRPSRGGRPGRLPRRGSPGRSRARRSSTPRSARTSSRSSGRSES